ncbi:MAG TPA: hypothetical protein VKH43_02220 [Thermoanaerobaculia bacterium]|nr:hypothetical protein [Thermoanaerobaculia bacterium]
MNRSARVATIFALVLAAVLAGGAGTALLGICGPFTDVSDPSFCNFVIEIFVLGITTGTTPTTFDPAAPVSRLQMAALLSRTVDATLARGGRRAALDQLWVTQGAENLGLTVVGSGPVDVRSDGSDIWVACGGADSVTRVHASTGRSLESWSGAAAASSVIPAMGRVVVTGSTAPGRLFSIDPGQPAGAVTTVASSLGSFPGAITFDGGHFWTANQAGSVSIVTPAAAPPWDVTNVTSGFQAPAGILFDSANVWVTDAGAGSLVKLDSAGSILETVTVGSSPRHPAYDGANIWVPDELSDSVSVVRAATGALLRTLTGNALSHPLAAAFDGQRILVTSPSGDRVSLWKAADLTPIGSFSTGAASSPHGACSDGINFWITLGSNQLARF